MTETLAERLGYTADARLLIVNCDDFGSSHAANVATMRALETGIATSATLMVPCPWAREAVDMAAGKDIGVHLTLTCEYPGYRWRSLTGAKSLHDDDGFMPATTAEVFERADPGDVFAELQAQIQQAIDWGLDPTHLDSHMGSVQLEARMFDIYLGLAEEFDLPLRMPGRGQDEKLGFDGWVRTAERGLLHNENFISAWPRDTGEVLKARLAHLNPGVTEVFGHPVDDGPELRGYDPDHPDIRANDAVVFCDPSLKAMIDAAGVTRISYRPLRDLQRAERSAA
ncbi:MAG TPA: polysaccharide deacetylase family protein [Caulobacteraceae bacterium]|nr:polysaccharide deacetylase family protein [Caulobacteraceae bacterium]